VRDLYTAGGRQDIKITDNQLLKVPKVLVKFIKNFDAIVDEFNNTTITEFEEAWKMEIANQETLKRIWIKAIVEAAYTIYDFNNFMFQKWLTEKLP